MAYNTRQGPAREPSHFPAFDGFLPLNTVWRPLSPHHQSAAPADHRCGVAVLWLGKAPAKLRCRWLRFILAYVGPAFCCVNASGANM